MTNRKFGLAFGAAAILALALAACSPPATESTTTETTTTETTVTEAPPAMVTSGAPSVAPSTTP